MEKIATENLFLLEFLVDSVNLDPKCDCALGEGNRCVSFQFLDNAPLDVCQDNKPVTETDSLKSGKSCLFSLTPDQASEAMNKFDVYVTLFKMMPEGWLPEKVEIGEALISIANLFADLITSVETSDGTTPIAKTLKDSFQVTKQDGSAIGKIGVYIRMSCFGKLIVTQFQMNLDDKSVLFRDKEGKSLYRYKKAGKGRKGDKSSCQEKRQASTCGLDPPWSGIGGGFYGQGPYQGGYNIQCPIDPCATNMGQMGMSQIAMGQMGMSQIGMGQMGMSQIGMGQMGMSQIGMGQMGMGQMNMPQTPCSECGAIQQAPCMFSGMGSYPQMLAYYPTQEQAPPKQPSCLPSEVIENPPNTPNTTREMVDVALPESVPVRVCGVKTEDENKEVFVLKIGKKKLGCTKNPKLELEMVTPKGKELKPIPTKETRETQYDPADVDKNGKKDKGGKKGKGGKGKGKGKKKK